MLGDVIYQVHLIPLHI